ncbi:MAG: hypothetical protein ACREUF_07660, partial [Solimonas sp.]
TIAFAAGLLTVGMIMAGITASAALAFKADEIAEDGAVRGLFDVSLMAYNVAGFPLTLFVLAVSGGLLLTHDMDRWLGWAGLAVGVVAASSLTAMFAEDGFWAFDGAWGFISGIVVAAWMVAVSVVMMFPQVVHHVHPAMPAPMAHA